MGGGLLNVRCKENCSSVVRFVFVLLRFKLSFFDSLGSARAREEEEEEEDVEWENFMEPQSRFSRGRLKHFLRTI
jgi:hypothetical protein